MKFVYPEKLNPVLVEEMTAYEKYLAQHFPGSRVVVHNDWAETGHTTDSQHYSGNAVDFHVEGVSSLNAWLALERFLRLGGIGFYPDWKPVPGFHADVRQVPYRARWARLGSKYVAMDRAVLAPAVLTV